VAACVATLAPAPLEARSHCSAIPDGGVKLEALLQAPPKTSNALGAVVVIEGAPTEVDEVPPPWLPEALIEVAPETSSIPPEMSTAAPPVSVKVYDGGSFEPAILYQAWMRTSFAFDRSVLGTAVQPAGAVMLRRFPP